MALTIPPRALINNNAGTVSDFRQQWTSIIAYHAGATAPWLFYEVLDQWMGPWGINGYPIGYGRFYCQAFSDNERLNQNPTTQQWVRRTMILLQEALLNFLVVALQMGRIREVTEPELRQVAFASHAQAYTQAGLDMVVMTEPMLLPVIMSIPGKEFNPASPNYNATMMQVLETASLVIPRLVGNTLATFALPAHTGILGRAIRQDQQAFQNQITIGRYLSSIDEAIVRGDLDNLAVLDTVTGRLESIVFPDRGLTQLANQVLDRIRARRSTLVDRLQKQVVGAAPTLRNDILRSTIRRH